MDIQSDGIWRYPRARPLHREDEWWVKLPERGAERVLLRGVLPSDEADELPTIRESLHEAVTAFRDADTLEPEDAAISLAKHFAVFGAVELCRHGLPIWHDHREHASAPGSRRTQRLKTSCPTATVDGSPAIRVRDVQAMLACWTKIENAPQILAGGNGLSRAVVTDLLTWPVLTESLRKQYMAATSGGPIRVDMGHRLVSTTVTAMMRAARLSTVLLWQRQQPPALGFRSETTLGLYTADLVARIGRSTTDGSYTCSVCTMPYTPRRPPRDGEQRVCRQQSCQAQRRSENVRAHRARRRAPR